jgi:isopenicillin N synthase-like dioxygenase
MAKSGQEFDVPIIDLSPSYASSEGRQQVAEEIRQACLSSGFFYITSHGISASVCDGVLQQAAHLFKHSSLADKRRIHIDHSPHGYGWEPSESTSIAGDVETKEAFNWCYSDDLDPTGGDGQYVQLDGTRARDLNQWPSENSVPGFHDAVKTYYGEALLLARHLCRLFALSLALPETYFDSKTTHPSANSRIMFYPKSSPMTDDVGLGAHTDYQCFTILLCSSTPGLEILSPSGHWVRAPVVPGGLVVNIGDMMMRWTNGLYKSTMHRVINRTGEERYSVPMFFGINNDELVEVCHTLVTIRFIVLSCVTGIAHLRDGPEPGYLSSYQGRRIHLAEAGCYSRDTSPHPSAPNMSIWPNVALS